MLFRRAPEHDQNASHMEGSKLHNPCMKNLSTDEASSFAIRRIVCCMLSSFLGTASLIGECSQFFASSVRDCFHTHEPYQDLYKPSVWIITSSASTGPVDFIRFGRVIRHGQALLVGCPADFRHGVVSLGRAVWMAEAMPDLNPTGDVVLGDHGIVSAPEGFRWLVAGWAHWVPFLDGMDDVQLFVAIGTD
jgi:hypothetical protein